MDITDVQVKLACGEQPKLLAFCSVTFDGEFVVQDLKVIDGPDGYFVAMPSRKVTRRCPQCGTKNHRAANFCNECGAKLPVTDARDGLPRKEMFADVAHPINARCRDKIHRAVVDAYRRVAKNAARSRERREEPDPIA